MADVERALVEHDVETVFHLGAQTLVGRGYRSPHATFESNIRGTYTLLEACRRHAGAVRRIVVASSDKAYGESAVLPYTEEMPRAGAIPTTSPRAAPICSRLLRRDLRAAGRRGPLRQHLRRRRPELEPPDARHDPLGAVAAGGR